MGGRKEYLPCALFTSAIEGSNSNGDFDFVRSHPEVVSWQFINRNPLHLTFGTSHTCLFITQPARRVTKCHFHAHPSRQDFTSAAILHFPSRFSQLAARALVQVLPQSVSVAVPALRITDHFGTARYWRHKWDYQWNFHCAEWNTLSANEGTQIESNPKRSNQNQQWRRCSRVFRVE